MTVIIATSNKRNEYRVIRDRKTVGRIRYWGASREDRHEWEFLDRETKVYGSRPGITLEEYTEIVSRFYEKKDASAGFVTAQDEWDFRTELKNHSIGNYWNEGNVFFFYDENDLMAARILL